MKNFFNLYLLCFTSILTFTVKAEILPVEAFGRLPATVSVKLSPSGESIAYVVNDKGGSMIGITNFVLRKTQYILKTDNEKFKIGKFHWANDHMILASSYYPVFRNGIAHTESRLMKVYLNDKDKSIEPVIRPRGKSYYKKAEHVAQFQDNIIDLIPEDPDHIIMSVDFELPNLPSVYKIDLNDGKRERLVKGRAYISNWLTDQQHRVRLGFGRDETKIFYRLLDLKTNEWRNIWEYEIFDAPDITPLGFGLDPNILYIRADHKGRYAIFKVDVSKAELPRELALSDPKYDIEGSLIYSNKTREVIGVYHGEESDGKFYFDQSYAKFQKAINKSLPSSYNNVSSFSQDERKYILYSSSDKVPGGYYFGDRDKGSLEFLLEEYPMLANKPLSGKERISFKARDGLKIEGYVTKAQGGGGGQSPAIILPHGGPMARDYGGFDWMAEFFSNRGYTVLQPNFRGSSGYGFAFEMEAIQKYGGAMQDDLQDAADWLAKTYKVDKNRVCIVGGSYGGYAALMAAATQQSTFSCAVSFAGVADLELQLLKSRKFTNHSVAKKQYGENQDNNSPINLVKNISIPVLLLHGDKDRVVSVDHSRNMASKLNWHDKDFEYIEFENGNHYLQIEKHRLAALTAIETFLNKHIGKALPAL